MRRVTMRLEAHSLLRLSLYIKQIREPYSAIRFLAENVALDEVLDLKPRTQLFDGIEEELVRALSA